MKSLKFTLFLLIALTQKLTLTMELSNSSTSNNDAYSTISDLPNELIREIIDNITLQADSVSEALENIYNLSLVNKRFALFVNDKALLRYLLEKIINKFGDSSINIERFLYQALLIAIESQNLSAVKMLLKLGANVDFITPANQHVIRLGGNPDTLLTKAIKITPAKSVIANYRQIIESLFVYSRSSEFKNLALATAFQTGNYEYILDLMKANLEWIDYLKINQVDLDQRLISAIKSRKAELVEFLLNYFKANVNAQDQLGDTPLIWAIRKGDLQIVKILLDADAYTYYRDNFGISHNVVEIAKNYRQNKIADLIEQYQTTFHMLKSAVWRLLGK